MDEIIAVDYTQPAILRRLKRIEHELILKAFRSKTTRITEILDATAGFGVDALLLAQAGYTVTLLEKEPAIAKCLIQSHHAGLIHPETQIACQKMTCFCADATEYLSHCRTIDAIYLDPLFSETDKKSLGPKKMQSIHQRASADVIKDAELLALALQRAKHWVVVKRPRKAAPLIGPPVHSQIIGTTIRFDRYLGNAT